MAVMRQIPASDAALRRGEWPTPATQVLHGKTLGVVGRGRVGRHVARIGKAFGMRVADWSLTLTDEAAASAGAERRELDDLLGEADVVTIHVSLSPSSRGLLDARRIALMKGAALLRRRPKGLLPAARQELLDPSKAWWGGRRGRLADRPRYSISVSLGVVPRWYSRVVEVPVRIEVAAGFVAPGASEPPRLQPSWPPGGFGPAHG